MIRQEKNIVKLYRKKKKVKGEEKMTSDNINSMNVILI